FFRLVVNQPTLMKKIAANNKTAKQPACVRPHRRPRNEMMNNNREAVDGFSSRGGKRMRKIFAMAILGLVMAAMPVAAKPENGIEVLPLSGFDDRIRLATYRAIYRQPGLDRLSVQAVPPIHIIVKNGNVTLEGVVPTKGDATRAFLAANGVSGVFSVMNNLR